MLNLTVMNGGAAEFVEGRCLFLAGGWCESAAE